MTQPIFADSTGVRLFVDGLEITSYFQDFATADKKDVLKAPVFGATALGKQAGLRDGTITAQGWRKQTVLLPVEATLRSGHIVSGCWDGLVIGDAAVAGQGFTSELGDEEKLGQLIIQKVQFAVSRGLVYGVVLGDDAAISGTVNTTYYDAGAASSGGVWTAFCHLLSGTGGSLVAVVQHSPDHSTWSTLATFKTFGDAPDWDVQSGTGVVQRYRRVHYVATTATYVAPVLLAAV